MPDNTKKQVAKQEEALNPEQEGQGYEEPTIEDDNDDQGEEAPKFKGKYTTSTGRRKSSIARVRLFKKGSGIISVNDKKISKYFSSDKIIVVKQPLRQSGLLKDFNFSVVVKGGGTNGQAEAIRHGIARALVEYDENLKPAFKAKGWISRDDRTKERKKPGLKKARRRPQWSKR